MAHRGIVVIAYPGGDKVVGGITDGPVISEIVRSAGFNGDLVLGNVEDGMVTKSGGAGLGVGKDVID